MAIPPRGLLRFVLTRAAVAAAVHEVLVHYFPAQAASNPAATPPFIGLDERYSSYLASLPETPAEISEGVALGQQAAAALIALREGDGIFGVSTYVFQTPGPGVYQPTPPFPYVGPQTPWIANMKPFTMTASDQFLPEKGPTPLASEEWAEDYNLTKAWGSLTIVCGIMSRPPLACSGHPIQANRSPVCSPI